jgi:hypothetical protein
LAGKILPKSGYLWEDQKQWIYVVASVSIYFI